MNALDQQPTRLEKNLAMALGFWLIGCVICFIAVSARWPLVGDVTYLHYVIFLMRHGMAPYREIVDMNLPAAYMLEGSVMASLGAGAVGWRLYDFLLMSIAAVSMVSILRLHGRLAGIFAASLFVMVHAQDGEIMSGERDFAVAILLLAGVALLFSSLRKQYLQFGPLAASGSLFGAGACIKPSAVPFVICLLMWTGWMLHRRSTRIGPAAFAVVAGFLLPCMATVLYLIRYGAADAFLVELHGLIPYHASLAHRSFWFLIGHSLSPVLPMVFLWGVAIAAAGAKVKLNSERFALLICAICGLLSYLLQQKGFAYQRYPFLAFLIILMAGDFVGLAKSRTILRLAGCAGLLAGSVFCTVFLIRTTKFDRGEPDRPLLRDLEALGAANRQIQCMDTAGSCIDNLYAGQIVQNTGFLYDCYMLNGTNSVALELRNRFWEAMERNPPRLIVVTDSVCYDPAPSFDKFAGWPEFPAYLAANYSLARTSGPQRPVRYWSRAVTPFAYRIYVHR